MYIITDIQQASHEFGIENAIARVLNLIADTKTKVLRITRTFKNASGKEYTRTELVRMITSDNY